MQTITCPVSVGDTVYFKYWDNQNKIYVGYVSSISISCNKLKQWKQSFRVSYKPNIDYNYLDTVNFSIDDIGIKVFLSKNHIPNGYIIINEDKKDIYN